MAQILISGHGNFASGMLSAAQLIIGRSAKIEAVDFVNGPEKLKKDLAETIERLNDGSGFIIFTDLLGATPFQTAVVVIKETGVKARVVGGTNLSMILAAAINTGKVLEETLSLSLQEGKQFIDYYRYSEEKIQNRSESSEEGI
ncbi:PTS sugar transporter subunit IIA [Sporolactobacillus terrae]|uniref:PTS EIIA type-4 domain-containing protein n=1 Tax=Sporolactobacillus terrae TaxID=269673 RepID=A0ABX5Q4R1_9BACL|nr:PTS sugar transporter subunit IIA [Sporolactobacillus terrae]QAA21622.1 hypothetical protein C0674_02745 [Sporolactobacillus terrae]QAA24594.1 hypothetical protein C0679_02725 [Sporolactobacillus terrae]UAK16431.1 PTS sugar transporter subunit IIA [Sporolactobacillus terrae]